MVRPIDLAALRLITKSNFAGLLDGQVGGFGALQDLVDEHRHAPPCLDDICAIADQPTGFDIEPESPPPSTPHRCHRRLEPPARSPSTRVPCQPIRPPATNEARWVRAQHRHWRGAWHELLEQLEPLHGRFHKLKTQPSKIPARSPEGVRNVVLGGAPEGARAPALDLELALPPQTELRLISRSNSVPKLTRGYCGSSSSSATCGSPSSSATDSAAAAEAHGGTFPVVSTT